ncbi:uncharacterized protein LOC128215785 [Mya arenaria]|uniref:uncharacterized protein LOC128215785 n=1 Tax=Mya arenaria TaxID=6604 RepID=UPI0022E25C69|nr:uncharacterized protein LOC128215785 [Mya arenaria]
MSFKMYTMAILMGICLLISKAQPESDDADDRKACTTICFETQNTYGRSQLPCLTPDRNTNNDICQKYCMKHGNQCFARDCTTYDKERSAKSQPADTTTTTTRADDGSQSEQKNAKGYPHQDCPPQDCAALHEGSGVSVGAAVGLLLIGLMVGAMATAALCVCCPSVYAKAYAVRSGTKETGRANMEDGEIVNATAQKSRPMPSAPLATLPADIRSTPTTAQNANCVRPDSQHIYSESMDLSVGSTNTYNAPGYNHANNNSSLAPVTSPTYGYNKFANDVIPGTSISTVADSAYQPLNADRSQNAGYNQIPAVRDDGDLRSQEHTDPSGSHQYFVLEKNGAMGSTEIGLRDNDIGDPHDYFVLEKR